MPVESSFLSVTSMWWLRTRPLTRPVPPYPLPLSTISLWTPLPFLNPTVGISLGMSSSRRHRNTLDTRPPIHREMARQTLNRDAFKKRISVLAVSVPAEKASRFLKSQELRGYVRTTAGFHNVLTGLRRSIIDVPKTKSVIRDPSNPDKRLVLFRVPEFGQFLWCCVPHILDLS